MNFIVGNGVSAYIIAACLDYKKEEFEILKNKRKNFIPKILYLRYDTEEELEFYKKLFKIHFVFLYKRKIKVGYYYDNKIHNFLDETHKNIYLKKQGRSQKSSSMSDGLSTYYALNLHGIIKKLKRKYKNDFLELDDSYIPHFYTKKDTVYDTMNHLKLDVPIESFGEEYIFNKAMINTHKYDYVYDCTENNIKRYTKHSTEFLSMNEYNDVNLQKNCKVILNYYSSPKIYKHNNIILISRYATKTQLKQKDIINYVIYEKGDIKNV